MDRDSVYGIPYGSIVSAAYSGREPSGLTAEGKAAWQEIIDEIAKIEASGGKVDRTYIPAD